MSTSRSGEEVSPLTSSPLVPRHPRVSDAVLAWGVRATIIRLSAVDAHLAGADGRQYMVAAGRLRWVADRDAWVVIPWTSV